MRTYRLSSGVWAAALIASFALLLVAPLLATLADVLEGPDAAHEERRARTPSFSRGMANFVGEAKWYFERRFGLRTPLARLHAYVKVNGLGISSSDQVVLGRDSWLFTAEGDTLDDFRGLAGFAAGQLTQLKGELLRRRDLLASRGIRYVVLLSPDKHTTYWEKVPVQYRRMGKPSRWQQSLEVLRQETDLEIVDLTGPLAVASDAVRVFHRSDSHWNEVGAYIGARELLKHLKPSFPELQILPDGIPPVRSEESQGGDLSRQLALQQGWVEEALIPDVPMEGLTRADGSAFLPFRSLDVRAPPRVVIKSEQGEPGTITVLRDSFGVALMPWLSPHFRKSVYRATYQFPPELIEEDAPLLVVQQLVERKLPVLISAPAGAPLFVGHSLVAGGDWRHLSPRHINAGVDDTSVQESKRRLRELLKGEPEQVFLQMGINGILAGVSTEDSLETIRDVLVMIRSNCSRARIVVQSLLPLRWQSRPEWKALASQVLAFNRGLEKLAEEQGTFYVDLHSRFVDGEGQLGPELTTDGIHLTPQGYSLWYSQLKPFFQTEH